MKALIKEDLVDRYEDVLPGEINEDIKKFLLSIEGKEVKLVFDDEDAYAEANTDIWLPDELWAEVINLESTVSENDSQPESENLSSPID